MEKITGTQWPSLVIQGLILGNISIIWSQKGGLINGYFLLSAILIIALFILQVISRRMFFLFPGNEILGPTPRLDTYILRTFIALAVVSFFFGLALNAIQSEILICLEKCLNSMFFFIVIILLFLIWPLIFGFCIKKEIRNEIDKKIEDARKKNKTRKGKELKIISQPVKRIVIDIK